MVRRTTWRPLGRRIRGHTCSVMSLLRGFRGGGRPAGRCARRSGLEPHRQTGGVVDVDLGVVVVVAGVGVDPADGADHLGGEEDVVGRHHVDQQIDAGLVVDAGVVPDVIGETVEVPALVLGHTFEPTPVVGHGATAVGDDPAQVVEVGHEARGQGLHEGGGVGAEVVGAGGVEVVVAGRRHVDHGRHVEFTHRFPQRPPVAVVQGRAGPEPAGRIGVDVAADEPHLLDAASEFGHRIVEAGPRRLGQLADGSEVLGKEIAHPPDQIVLVLRPELGGVLVADVVGHPRGPGREDREIGTPLPLQP